MCIIRIIVKFMGFVYFFEERFREVNDFNISAYDLSYSLNIYF